MSSSPERKNTSYGNKEFLQGITTYKPNKGEKMNIFWAGNYMSKHGYGKISKRSPRNPM